jgi:succinoglycan biosynthesis protein ExoA
LNPSRRVLHIRASRFVGGPERQILRYAKLVEDAGVHTTIATFVGFGEGEALRRAAGEQGTEVLSLPPGSLSALRALKTYLRTTPQAVICTHGYKADILGIAAGRLTGTPVASFLRGWTGEDSKVRLYEALNRSLLRFSDRIVCLSETQRTHMDPVGEDAKLFVVVNATEAKDTPASIPAAALREQLQLPANAMIVASAGRLSPEKGTKYFLAAAKSLAAEFSDAHFVIFGDGTLRRELEASAKGFANIRFAGHRTDFRRLVGGIDVLVNPSLTEEMPNVVMEAMASGVPVIATAVGGVPEIASQPQAVKLVPAGDTDALASAIRTLLADSAAAKRLGESGRRRILEAYSPERQKQQLLELLSGFLPAAISLSPLPPMPFISIVVPVRNEERHLGAVLKQLAEQDYPADRYEILVADGNSTDGTRRFVEDFARSARILVRALSNPKQLSSAGRNVGALASQGDVIVFIDGHCRIPSPQLLRNISSLLHTTGAACLCRPQPLHVEGNTRFQEALAHTRATLIGHGRDSTIFDMDQERFVNPTSSGAIYRAEVFEKVGLYDEGFDACEDVEFNHRVGQAGFTSYSSPQVAVHYSPRTSLGGLWRQLGRYGRGRYRFMRKHPEAISPAQLVPAAFVLWLTGLASLSWTFPAAAWTLLGTFALYLLVTLGFAIHLSFRYGWHHLLISPAVYACIHFGLGFGFWREALFGRKPQLMPYREFKRSIPPQTMTSQDVGARLTSATSNKR